MKAKAALKSMRLRTLPLSTGGVLLGILLAAADYHVSWGVAVLIVLTTVCLQILSNLSNELGDVLHGTDTAERVGPQYGLNGGQMSVKEMKWLIGVFVVLSMVSGTAMILASFGTLLDLRHPLAEMDWTPTLLLLLGAGAIMGAMKYTLGRLLLPGAAVGCFSVGVLNVNNIRDMKTDAPNRVTVAIRLGEKRAKIYQTGLIVLGWALMLAYCQIRFFSLWHYLYVLTLPLFVLHLRGVWKRHERELDPMLPLLVVASFLFCLLGGIGFCVYLF